MTPDIPALRDELATLRASLPGLALAGGDTSAARLEIARLEDAIAAAEERTEAKAEAAQQHRADAIKRTASDIASRVTAIIGKQLAALEPPAAPKGI